jgi:hypothetical protein
MNLRCRQLVRHLLLIAVAASPAIGAAQLNPTVKVLPRATTPVPPECAEGTVMQTPVRLPEETTAAPDVIADMQPPPTATLRGELQTAVESAQRGDRNAFRIALSNAKKIFARYPPGGERTADEQLIALLDDVNRLFDFQFATPTGSFFPTSTDVYGVLTRYPGYETAVRHQTIVDQNGVKFYPMRESRDFLVQQMGGPYMRMTGKALPARPVVRPVTMPAPIAPRSAAKSVTPKPKALVPVVHEARATTVATTTHHRTSNAKPKAKPKPASKPAPVAEKAATPKPAPAPPATTSSATTTTTTAAAPAVTTSEPTATTASTDTTATATTAEPQKKPETPGGSFFVPALLILVGLGVLVVLIRASS